MNQPQTSVLLFSLFAVSRQWNKSPSLLFTPLITIANTRVKTSKIVVISGKNETLLSNIRDWSKSIGGGPEHLEMWLIKNT